jgi:pimeloyl-ACP methyl ester carboxylesterase
VRLSPPGFGAPLPDDFSATYIAYRDWLEGELENFGEPVDVVGHDWGGGHVMNVVMHRPELVRSWVSDILGCFDPDFGRAKTRICLYEIAKQPIERRPRCR